MDPVDPGLVDKWKLPEPAPQKPNLNKNLIAVIAACALLVFMVSAVLGIRLLSNNGDEEPTPVAAPTTTTQTSTPVSSTKPQTPTATSTPAPETETVTIVETVVATATPQATTTGGSIPCDGRGVLIVYSVIDTGQDIAAEASGVIAQYPGARMLAPGACSSLRASVNGNAVYAIVLDYGFDTPLLCTAAAEIGGNPRTMNTSGDFTSPC